MKDFFAELFEYNHHYNQQLLLVFFNDHKGKISERSENIFNHMLYAHHTWNSRILEKPNQYGIWEIRPLHELDFIEKENYSLSLSILQDLALETEISYKNSLCKSFSNNLRNILFHIINHSTYHRGQIALDFRETGIEPLVSDYIFYKRR